MKKLSTKTGLRSKGSGRKAKGDRGLELDRGWNELEAQADRLKSDWMSRLRLSPSPLRPRGGV